jgi:GrpB-like predicted nucleotidyltransferase (UPF0157 family)
MTTAPVLVPYNSDWPRRAEALIDLLRVKLAPTALRIDHIGSTAIPDMAAKDVLDVQVSVSDLDVSQAQFDGPLRALGFSPLPYGHDHVPVGSHDTIATWSKRLWCRRGGPHDDVNLHVRLVGSPNERFALLFRDWMRAHPEAVGPYSAIKRALAETVADVETYSNVKDPVVDLVIAMAEPWALATGWSP